ncbi:MAG: exonuclease domain-containing protein [Pseudomonadota bacterium]
MLERWRFERQLRGLAKRQHEVLCRYANADWPERHCPAAEAPFVALDFELDGLRADAHLLQAGWVPFAGQSISMVGAHSVDVHSDADLDAQAVTIHGIGEQRAAKGQPIEEVIHTLIQALAGRILVAHAAAIEVTALQRAVKAVFDAQLPVRSVCTLTLERELNPNLVGGEAYRLGPSRARYGLPEYEAHDALTDAIAAAELFQAQLSRLPDDVTLARLERS